MFRHVGGSEELWFFMSQCRKNLTRGKVIDKSDLLEYNACEVNKLVGRRMPHPELSRL